MPLSPQVLRQLDVVPQTADESPFVSAASGLCALGPYFYVVGDDEHLLARFPRQGTAPGVRVPLLEDAHAPRAHLAKKRKPDLEALCARPDRVSLLAVPSGSTALRHRGAVIRFDSAGAAVPERVDFRELFSRLAAHTRELNLEGAAFVGDALWLAQRGNKSTPNALFEVSAEGFAFRRALPLDLGAINGVPLTPTDLSPLPGGRLLVSAVCEDTADSYQDGALCGAALILLGSDFRPTRVEQLPETWKVEGISVEETATGLKVFMVCDADDPSKASPLLAVELPSE